MKRLVFSALILLYSYPAQLWAQSSNHNYIQTKILKNASGSASMDVIQYYDGLGRPEETVQKQASPQLKDLVSRLE